MMRIVIPQCATAAHCDWRFIDMAIDWEGLAKKLGYPNERAMLENEYARFSLNSLAKRLKISRTSIADKLSDFDIERRERGGPNHSKSKLGDKLKGMTFKDLEGMNDHKLLRSRGVTMRQAITFFVREEKRWKRLGLFS
jgi:hypothetical protein